MKKQYLIYALIALFSPISIVSPAALVYGVGKYTQYQIAKNDAESAKHPNDELARLEREKKQREFRMRFMHPNGSQ